MEDLKENKKLKSKEQRAMEKNWTSLSLKDLLMFSLSLSRKSVKIIEERNGREWNNDFEKDMESPNKKVKYRGQNKTNLPLSEHGKSWKVYKIALSLNGKSKIRSN